MKTICQNKDLEPKKRMIKGKALPMDMDVACLFLTPFSPDTLAAAVQADARTSSHRESTTARLAGQQRASVGVKTLVPHASWQIVQWQRQRPT